MASLAFLGFRTPGWPPRRKNSTRSAWSLVDAAGCPKGYQQVVVVESDESRITWVAGDARTAATNTSSFRHLRLGRGTAAV